LQVTLPILETKRLVLRQIEESDAEGLHGAFGNAEAMRFWDFPICRDVAETATRIQQSRAIDASWHGMWAIMVRAGGFAGMINYHRRETWNQRLELGVILTPLYWRLGIMSEAMRSVLQHCFSNMETHRVEATIAPEDFGSRVFLTKLGFTQEGLLRDWRCVGGQFRSVLMFSLLKNEWQAVERSK
jgi:ribosomal-protein-alanine N-acetyltransferase